MRKLLILLLVSLCFISGCSGKASQVTLLYTTDTHGRVASDKDIIGMDLIAAVKRDTPNSLLVDAGDYLQGNPTVNLTKGENSVRLMKMAGYYAATLGNHEFDFGKEVLQARIAEAAAEPNPFYMLSANILNEDGTYFTKPYVVTKVGGLKIGFFGLTTEETPVQTHPRNVHGLVFTDVLKTAEKMAQTLRAEGCDVVVALTHVGTEGVLGVKSTDIAAKVDGLDVVIDGHSHVELNETMPNGVLVVSSGAHAKALGKLVITRKASGAPLEKRNALLRKADVENVTPDPAVAESLKQIQKEQEALLSQVVGRTPVDLDAEREHIRAQSTNFGNLGTDAVRYMTKADITLINGGGIRRSIAKGDITKGDIIAAIPFADAVLTKEVTGAQLKEILEHGFRGLPNENGGFPQLSGLKVVVDAAKPAGSRVLSMKLDNGKSISPNGKYILAVTDFVGSGGDGYPVLAALPIIKQFMAPDAAMENYLKELGEKAFANIDAKRITIRNAQKMSALFDYFLNAA